MYRRVRLRVCGVWVVARVLDSLDVLSELFDQLDVDISLQEGGTHLLQHGIKYLHTHTHAA